MSGRENKQAKYISKKVKVLINRKGAQSVEQGSVRNGMGALW
jgi:hypothetical protein